MSGIIVAVVALLAVYAAMRWFVNANPSAVAGSWRTLALLGGGAAVLFLAVIGRVGLAVSLAALMATLYSRGILRPRGATRMRGQGSPKKSMVRSAAFEMELDHETGVMTGRVLAGSFEGKELDTLDPPALARLASEISADAESRALLEAYLDRRIPRWRENMKADAGGGNVDRRTRAP